VSRIACRMLRAQTLRRVDALWPRRVDPSAVPVLVMGDVNVEDHDLALRQFVPRFLDVWKVLNPREVGYTGPWISKRIDYIYLDKEFR
jgi:endonuclease/exonuclease/phosphatase family metal-dependent hydrolase